MQNSYLKLEKDASTGKYHPLLAGLEDAGRIINGDTRVEVEAVGKTLPAPLTLIPSYPDLPDGRSIRACREPTSLASICAKWARAVWFISHGTLTAPFGK